MHEYEINGTFFVTNRPLTDEEMRFLLDNPGLNVSQVMDKTGATFVTRTHPDGTWDMACWEPYPVIVQLDPC